MDGDDLFAAFSAQPAVAASTSYSAEDDSRANSPNDDGNSKKSSSSKRKKRKNREKGAANNGTEDVQVTNGHAQVSTSNSLENDENSASRSASKKRKTSKEERNGDTDMQEDSIPIPKASTSKIADPAPSRRRKVEIADPLPEQPLVADDFQQEAHTSVPASAGLLSGAAAAAANAAGDEIGGKITLSHQVRHQVALPPNYPYVPISQHVPPPVPARIYPFELDPFQKVSVASIERNESVLVSAHTSAGKTVVAEYAIAQCLRDKQRVIYTSPIKALSNQKYREMLAEFGDVGLMTGDVTINPTASCLVMTTEILRSMLYRGSEIMREVAWVVFDEIHYMRDKERGVVWEETIILLPPKVHYVFLSATIPNAMEFAEWICKTHSQPCHVVYTDYRPTPLQHYLFPANGDGIHLVVDEKGNFREDNFTKAMGALTEGQGEDPASAEAGKGRKGKSRKGGNKGPSDIYKIIKMIMLKQYNPVIVFAFSKKECEGLAVQMAKLEFNTDEEREMVAQVFENAISGLSDDDKTLPQIEHILPLLKRGIGIHHGGLLPILKEVIEILFQEGLIKVLFATETFSIGLNMPAKTVVFTNVRKWDGVNFRNLSGGEYIQMSGRAGRRGLDDRGIVIMMVDEKLEPSAAKGMVKGVADRLDSAFHLGYNMIINLMRVEGISPESMLSRCFYQFQSTTAVPRLEKELRELEQSKNDFKIEDEDTIADYYDIRQQLDVLKGDLRAVLNHPQYALPFLQPGRMVRIRHESADFGWGVVVNYQKRRGPRGSELPAGTPDQDTYIVDVLVHADIGASIAKVKSGQSFTSVTGIQPCPPGAKGEFVIIPCLLSTVDGLSQIRLHIPKDLKPAASREQTFKNVKEVIRRFPDGIGLLDPVENMGIKDKGFLDLLQKIEVLEGALTKNSLYKTSQLPAVYERYAQKQELVNHIRAIKKKIQAAESVMHLDELKHRKRVLRRLEFITSDDVVEMKGRVACEISTGDELLLTELIFHGVFNDLSPEQCAALCSCFVFDERSESQPKLREDLAGPLRRMQEFAKNIARVSKESKLELSEDEYVQSFKVGLMDSVYKWCKGASFSEICKMSDVFEGSLIRVFRRLQELLRQMAMAAKVIGNSELEEKFIKSLEALERKSSVVFNPSLYL